jgi:Transposase DDE domain
MSVTSKSPLGVAREALAVGSATFRDYSHRYSPKTYTQPQKFACLVLKVFFKQDYRGICKLLKELSDLRAVLGLKKVPHFTTLQKSAQKLLSIVRVKRMFTRLVQRFHRRRRRVRRAALDSTGFQCGHASSYYTRRRAQSGKTPVFYKHYAKLEATVDCATHFVLAASAGRGPSVDTNRFIPLLNQALDQILLDSVLADAGYDSEANHSYAREELGVRSFIPAKAGRPTSKPPSGRYRRRMKQRLDKNYGSYGQRWQVETVFSMIKRRLSASVAARTYRSQCCEVMLLVLSHNIMILLCRLAFSTEQCRGGLSHRSGRQVDSRLEPEGSATAQRHRRHQ